MGAPEKSQSSSNSMQRVKVYRLNNDGKWDDQGTGHVTVDYLERSEELGLFVIDEEDNETLLLHRIIPDDIYRKQEDTIISWRDPEYHTELALSFQETTGCTYIWDHICSVQRNLQFSSLNNETFHSINSELRELPAVELSTLPLILKTVSESGIADQMRLTELILNDLEFFRKLMDLFKICEDLENIEGLHMIFKIVRGIILLNSPQIFDKIFGDECIMDIIGSLEYDPDVNHIQHHRNFLKEHVVYKEAIPIKDAIVLSKIHQTYRVGYLKDVVLARVLDEGTVANLNSIIHANNSVVVSLLKDDSTFIQELFARLRSSATSVESKKNLVYFLYDFCSLSKSLQMVQQLRLFRDLMAEGIFDIITETLQSQDNKLVLTGTDILILFLNQDPNLLRSYVVRSEGIQLFGLLVKGMITDFGEDMHCQFLEILRSLLDSYTLAGAHAQRDNIVEIFYEKHLGTLIDVITASCPVDGIVSKSSGSDSGVEIKNGVKPEILSNICELLCFCVLHHPYRIKCNFLLNNVIDKVLTLTRRREKYLVVAAVRFVRTILSRHDEHLTSHFVKHNLLKPIVDAFVDNGNRYNLLHSAVLELFEFIRKESMKSLIKYIVDSFWNELVKFEHLASIQSFKVKYEQCLENCVTKNGGSTLDPRKRVDERALEKEEEEYFNEDSDEDTASASHAKKVQSEPVVANGVAASGPPLSSRPGGLVDYDDDEDDEDYKPPPKKQSETLEEDEGTLESLKLKRRLASRDKETETAKKQRLGKHVKARESVFAALCSTLSHAVLPSKKIASSVHATPPEGNKGVGLDNHPEEERATTSRSDHSSNSNSVEENHRDEKEPSAASRSCSDCLHGTSENGQINVEDGPLIPPKSSPEMTVNGS
ncbi:Serine/threonine-protein phosphatase 4 regulatory subunit 3 [Euphorbia peplus]|nr:Serine/threonine-protein phosphatase 4 regulatory subunit 3 [Euphorbia peplus]